MFTGNQIKAKRKELGLSTKELADHLNVNVENLYKWEKGTRPQDATDYLKVENWLSGKLETVPREKADELVMNDDPVAITKDKEADKYTRLLEDNDRFFKDLLKSNLIGLQTMLHSLLANVEAGFQYALDREAAGDVARAEQLKAELDKRIGEKMGAPIQRDSSAGR